jgi:mannose-6-phosphate isomerase-like protein (cupin superfamily)
VDISRRAFQACCLLLNRESFAVAAPPEPLRSRAFKYEELAVRENGPFRSRKILHGTTHEGCLLDLHESELPAGKMPHPPHRHIHEEMLLIRSGQIDITIDGSTNRLNPGSVAFIASNQLHGWTNTGTTTATYFVMAIGHDETALTR